MIQDIKIAIGVIGAIVAIYLFYAIIFPWGFALGSISYYQSFKWSCEKKGGSYLQKERDGYKYFECDFLSLLNKQTKQ